MRYLIIDVTVAHTYHTQGFVGHLLPSWLLDQVVWNVMLTTKDAKLKKKAKQS